MKRILILLIFLKLSLGYSQDPIFTQFYNIPEVLNTGFTGAYQNTKAGVIHRVQWPALNFSINTQFAYLDTSLDRNGKNGIGFSILNHKETNTRYNFCVIGSRRCHHARISIRMETPEYLSG